MPAASETVPDVEVVRKEASYWWRTSDVVGAILHRLMLLFIFVPLTLVYYRYYVPSFLVFGGIVPYGLLLQYLAQRSVIRTIRKHPEALEQFEKEGVIVRWGAG
jgi:hypothetical protein